MNAQKTPQYVLEDTSVKMSEVATPAVATGNRVSTTRIVGGVALAYAASLIVQNAVFVVSGAPDYKDPLNVVLAYHTENAGAMHGYRHGSGGREPTHAPAVCHGAIRARATPWG